MGSSGCFWTEMVCARRRHPCSPCFMPPVPATIFYLSFGVDSDYRFDGYEPNMALGFGGMYQFHHAVFYGVGAYTVSLMLMKSSFPIVLCFVVAPIVSAVLALVMGYICVRLSKLYFGMLQLLAWVIVWILVFRWYSFTGGDDGLHGIPVPSLISSVSGSYYFTLIVSVISLILMYVILNSPFGRILQAIRDNPGKKRNHRGSCSASSTRYASHCRFFRRSSRSAFCDCRRFRVPGPDVLDTIT